MSSWINTHRVGHYLIVDDIDGSIHWDDEMGRDWDGSYRLLDDMDGKHPDYDIRVYPREEVPTMINPKVDATAYSSVRSDFVGETTVSAADDYPGNHQF